VGFYSGKDGQLYLDGSSTAAAKVESWSLSATQATLDTTSLGDTDRTLIAGMRSSSGSCSIAYYSDDSGSNEATTLLNKIIKARSSASVPGTAADSATTTFKLGFKDYQDTVKYITVEGVITSANISSSQGEILKADISFEVNGAPTGVSI
tara:strand:+ start:64 stop:516 length:453 start_codon:yes stop_codon:yes gene_type:complete